MATADRRRGAVPLDRRFTPIAGKADRDDEELSLVNEILGRGNAIGWPDLLQRHRSVILAEAGAGKTFEMLKQAKLLDEAGTAAFFVRLEDIATGFSPSHFEVGSPDRFAHWMASEEDGWFFLDSIDEARLREPRDFEQAVRRFAEHIRGAEHRAHIILTGRPYAWRAVSDPEMIARFLPAPGNASNDEVASGEAQASEANALGLFRLAALRTTDVRLFAAHREAPDVDGFLHAVERRGLATLAERPFDLDDLLDLWAKQRKLGSRLEVLRHGIRTRLEEIDEDRAAREPLSVDRALDGARVLAAAVVLTGLAGIRVPDGLHHREGVVAQTLLVGWSAREVKALLGRAIFNDILFGMVRFRHREIRDLLAAEWLHGLIRDKSARRQVEAMIFREQYGEAVVAPRLRSLLPWLILWDTPIAQRLLAQAADIAIEDGDPALLSPADRRQILHFIVRAIVDRQGQGADNSEIARFAAPDLEGDVLALIKRHCGNDDVIFFLARVAWQGEMGACVEELLPIAADASRDRYARIAAARAVATLGGEPARGRLWDRLNEKSGFLQDLLIELLDGAPADHDTVGRLLGALDRMDNVERSRANELTEAIDLLIERLETGGAAAQAALVRLIEGLDALLAREPHVRDRNQHVSEHYQWLLGPAGLAVAQLIRRRAPEALGVSVLVILARVPVLRAWQGRDGQSARKVLAELVAEWSALNDALYWFVVEDVRARHALRDESLTDEMTFSWGQRLWQFGVADFPRCVSWITTRETIDDRLIALSRTWRLYLEQDKPAGWLELLEQAVADEPALAAQLARYTAPPPHDQAERWAREDRDFETEMAQREQVEADRIAGWIELARDDPDQLLTFPAPGDLTPLHVQLSNIVQSRSARGDWAMSDWTLLTTDAGEAVAHAYRDAARLHWRAYRPTLGSEGGETRSLPHELIFALAGLEIEAASEGFPTALNAADAAHAFRYLHWYPGNFPPWFELLYRAHPDAGFARVSAELLWELEQPSLEPIHYILHDLLYHAPWLHRTLGPVILDWLEKNEPTPRDYLRYCLGILLKGGTTAQRLAGLAARKVALARRPGLVPNWFALWVDTDPSSALPALEQHLASFSEAEASDEAQAFVVALFGGRHGPHASSGHYREAAHLGRLYLLMHRYIPSSSDIDRAGKGVYSPTVRDDAQEARNRLFELLRQIPGKPTYVELIRLASDHPEASYRHWMLVRARERAVADADLAPMTDEQLRDFAAYLDFDPTSHRQLYGLLIDRLLDLKAWLEGGNDSLATTYQRIETETEMRLVVAHWLNEHSNGRFSCPQEAELANAQRPDISVSVPGIVPVPIELKLLDASWTGPALCERLRNQLAGDYLRDRMAGCGVFLLIWQGRSVPRRWRIDGKRVGLAELASALNAHWQSIADDFPGVEAVEVITIDLTARARRTRHGVA